MVQIREYCAMHAEEGDEAEPILVSVKNRMKRMGLNLSNKQREDMQELYTIAPYQLEREMFKTTWTGRQFVELQGMVITACKKQGASYTVPHGYGYKI